MVIADRTEIPSPYLAQSLIILRQIEGRSFGLESTLLLTKALRDTIMSMSPVQPPPEWVSGHQADGKRSERTAGHLAFVPLPHVGRKHADGHVLGLAVAVPSDITQSEIARCLGAFLFDDAGWPKQIRLVLGKLGQCVLELDEGQAYRHALRSETWTGPSRRWATVTPIAIDRHAKFDDPHSQIERSIADGCERIGLPQPQDVIAAPVSMFIGSPHTRQMPRIQRKTDDGMIRQTHAVITFPCAVHGPVLLGAGRYRGYGLCRPLAVEEDET
jgi:CRISPR-associated protein Csb2